MISHCSVSSLTSISWRASIDIYNRDLKPVISDILKSDENLPNLVNKAEEMVKTFSADQRNIFTCRKGDEKATVNLHAVMSAMLTCVEECGGESGKRYVASAIVSCGRKGDDNMIEQLAALGATWLTHLLFIFKTSRNHKAQLDEEPSRLAIPTLNRTTSQDRERSRHRRRAFKKDIMVRDGYTCIITGLYDESHPAPNTAPDLYSVDLEACHILRQATGSFNNDPKSDSFKSAATSFDILVNFTRLPVTTVEKLHEILDDPSNGMLLGCNAQQAFDKFCWCLKPTETMHVYSLKVFRTMGFSRSHENKLITFEDHSVDFISGSSRKRPRSIPLPNPHYLAIHAAIAGILHMSGAGKFFDELLKEYKYEVRPIRSWLDLERRMQEVALRDSVAAFLQSADPVQSVQVPG